MGVDKVDNYLAIIAALLPLLEVQLTGKPKEGVNIAENLLKIAQASTAEYQAQTGKPIDPTLLQPIDKVE